MRRRALFLPLVAAALLAGCGKRGDPAPPGPDAAIIYPRTYPREEGRGPPQQTVPSVFPPSSRGVRGLPQ